MIVRPKQWTAEHPVAILDRYIVGEHISRTDALKAGLWLVDEAMRIQHVPYFKYKLGGHLKHVLHLANKWVALARAWPGAGIVDPEDRTALATLEELITYCQEEE